MADEERVWLTYDEVGKALRIKPASAKRLSFRRHWPHRAGNDGLARVGVPVTELRRDTGHATGDTHRAASGEDSGTVTGDTAALALALDRVEGLAVQLGQARDEIERLRGELVEVVRAREVAETAAEDARQQAAGLARRVEEAETAAVEGWQVARDLAALQPPVTPAGLLPLSPRRKGLLARLLGL